MRRILFFILLTAALNSNAQSRQDVILDALEAEYTAYDSRITLARAKGEGDRESALWFAQERLRRQIDDLRRGDEREWDDFEFSLRFHDRRSYGLQALENQLRAAADTSGTKYYWQRSNALLDVERARRAWERAEDY